MNNNLLFRVLFLTISTFCYSAEQQLSNRRTEAEQKKISLEFDEALKTLRDPSKNHTVEDIKFSPRILYIQSLDALIPHANPNHIRDIKYYATSKKLSPKQMIYAVYYLKHFPEGKGNVTVKKK